MCPGWLLVLRAVSHQLYLEVLESSWLLVVSQGAGSPVRQKMSKCSTPG